MVTSNNGTSLLLPKVEVISFVSKGMIISYSNTDFLLGKLRLFFIFRQHPFYNFTHGTVGTLNKKTLFHRKIPCET